MFDFNAIFYVYIELFDSFFDMRQSMKRKTSNQTTSFFYAMKLGREKRNVFTVRGEKEKRNSVQ